ncbi:MAG: SDR family oxidoreductase [SAR202 cluster bacterium]|nr:SDR family oxidoreductase [SAR202 cluster bacterium]
MELKGTVAVVTGGSGGLGKRICLALAEQGADIAVVYATSKDAATVFAKDLAQKGVRAEAFQCDVTDQAQVNAMVAAVVKRLGKVDILVNDAAYNKWIPFTDLDALTLDDWNKIQTTNVTGPFLCTKAVAPHMKKQKSGRIVNVSSVAGFYPSGSSIAYAVSKAALNHLTRCMSVSLAPDVLVNCVSPGYMTETRMTGNLPPEAQKRSIESSLLKRPAEKDDVASLVVEFCKTDSVTGQNIVVDSGRYFH